MAEKRARHHEPSKSRDRAVGWDLLGLLSTLPRQDLGLHIAVRVLRFLGTQSLAACCKASLEWLTCEGRRVCLCINDECRGITGPFAPLARIATHLVDSIRLGRYGRASAAECAEMIAACHRAFMLRFVYAKLTGVGAALELRLSHATLPCLRKVRFHQCRLLAEDAALFFCLAHNLEQADFYGEAVTGLGEALSKRACSCPNLLAIEFTDCDLQTEDARALFELFGASLRTVHIQAGCTRGLRVPRLPYLQVLRLQDCCMVRQDAIAIMEHCPALKDLALCGNALATEANIDQGSSDSEGSVDGHIGFHSWPQMQHLLHADFRACDLSPEDEEELRKRFPCECQILVQPPAPLASTVDRNTSSQTVPPRGCQHIIFQSSDEEC